MLLSLHQSFEDASLAELPNGKNRPAVDIVELLVSVIRPNMVHHCCNAVDTTPSTLDNIRSVMFILWVTRLHREQTYF